MEALRSPLPGTAHSVDPNIYPSSPSHSTSSSVPPSDDDELLSPAIPTVDPLTQTLDELEERLISSLDSFKLHPGTRSDPSTSIHDELRTLLQPILEIASHLGPSTARRHAMHRNNGVDESVEEVYSRLNSELVLPVMLEAARCESNVAKRAAALQFFHNLYRACRGPGSYLDPSPAETAGPTGSGTGGGGTTAAVNAGIHHVPHRALMKKRMMRKMAREGELLVAWVEASLGCLTPGAFTAEKSELAISSRAVLAANAAVRPCWRYIAGNIGAADDAGATKLYEPTMKMIEGVLKKLFLSDDGTGSDAMRSSCLKFLESVLLSFSFSKKTQRRKRMGDFSLEDLPSGHPTIVPSELEQIGEYAFTTLRGLIAIGGQVKIENLELFSTDDDSLSSSLLAILKTAALSSLSINPSQDEFELDFSLTQKSYAIVINALSISATTRPGFFKQASETLARRVTTPPAKSPHLPPSAIVAVTSQLKSTCLTLLRNPLSYTTGAWNDLLPALKLTNMEIQAQKALGVAKHTAELKNQSRHVRNQAKIFYQWDESEASSDSKKRQREEELEEGVEMMKKAKRERGLGMGIKLPVGMVDRVELILKNLEHLPKRVGGPNKSPHKKKSGIMSSLDDVVDAIVTNGASLRKSEGSWYEGEGWTWKDEDLEVGEEEKEAWHEQRCMAAGEAFGRIVTRLGRLRDRRVKDFGEGLASRLAWMMEERVKPTRDLKAGFDLITAGAKQSEETCPEITEKYPLVTSCLGQLVTSGTGTGQSGMSGTVQDEKSLSGDDSSPPLQLPLKILNTCYLSSADDSSCYSNSLTTLVSGLIHASQLSNQKPSDSNLKRLTLNIASYLPRFLLSLPSLSPEHLSQLCQLTQQPASLTNTSGHSHHKKSIAQNAAQHALKNAHDKRATSILHTLRDVAFYRPLETLPVAAVNATVDVAIGTYSSGTVIEDRALRLLMNKFYSAPAPSNSTQSFKTIVENAVTNALIRASDRAISKYDDVRRANDTSHKKMNATAPQSDEEKKVMEMMTKPVLLFMALCVKNVDFIKTLLEIGGRDKADVLAKEIRANMGTLAKPVGKLHGAGTVARKVADMISSNNNPHPNTNKMFFSFLEHLEGDDDFVEACKDIRELRGGRDPRYIVPVLPQMTRKELVAILPEFVAASDMVYRAGLVRMSGDKLTRKALLFREEEQSSETALLGMTLCEELVFLHRLDFAKAKLPQKRYLDAIKICLEDDALFSDRVIMAALDHMSMAFLEESQETPKTDGSSEKEKHLLPVAYMRTVILTVTKHESLHMWICDELLPRLIEARIYEDKRQWEGWMRCASKLEQGGASTGGINSLKAIKALPEEQLKLYRDKYPKRR